jgi:hypothetical protein
VSVWQPMCQYDSLSCVSMTAYVSVWQPKCQDNSLFTFLRVQKNTSCVCASGAVCVEKTSFCVNKQQMTESSNAPHICALITMSYVHVLNKLLSTGSIPLSNENENHLQQSICKTLWGLLIPQFTLHRAFWCIHEILNVSVWQLICQYDSLIGTRTVFSNLPHQLSDD